ncbi:MAG: hypothetical protein LUC47_04715 [Clostridiales bacterium]|nr:hypothetical protein [Clostridiales bacterium]
MAKTKAKRLLSLLLSLAMVFSLAVTPVYATGTGETSSEATVTTTDESGGDPADSSGGDTSADSSVEVEETTEEANSESSEEETPEETTTTVAAIGETTYETLSAAFSAVKNGEIITLTGDETVTGATYNGSGLYQVRNKAVTLDLCGHTLTVDTTRVFGVLNGGSLTVKNGTVAISEAGDYTQFNILRGNCSFAAENVTFNGGGVASNFLHVADGGVATIALTNCDITNMAGGSVVYDDDGASTVTLTGCNYSIKPVNGVLNNGVDNYTIVFNDHNIIGAESTNYEATNALYYNYVVADGGSITRSSTLSLNKNYGDASLTVKGGEITANVTVADGTSMTVESGTVTGTITVKAGGALTGSGGAINGRVSTYGDFTMTGGTVTKTEDISGNEAVSVSSGTVNISGGTITDTTTASSNERAIVFGTNCTATGTITGGNFVGVDIALLARTSENNGVVITGGSYTAKNSLYMVEPVAMLDERYGAYDTAGNTAVKSVSGTVTIYRSTQDDKTVEVKESGAVAKISGAYYTSIADAFAAAADGDTVTLVDDVTLNASLVYENTASVTLDLNGKTITFAYDGEDHFNGAPLTDGAWGLKVASGAMTIVDTSADGTGTIQTADVNTYVDVVGASGSATLNIEGGSFTTNSIYEAVVFATGSATVNISGGTFTNSATSYAYNSAFKGIVLNVGNGSGATISVTGGTFYGESPASGDDSGSPETFVAEGYMAFVNEDGSFTVGVIGVASIDDVHYETLQAAFDAAEDGDTVVLLADVTESITVGDSSYTYTKGEWDDNDSWVATPDFDFTLDLNGYNITAEKYSAIIVYGNAALTITGKGTVSQEYALSTWWWYNNNDTYRYCYSCAVRNYGVVTINGGTYTCAPGDEYDEYDAGVTYYNDSCAVWNDGEMTINGGTFSNSQTKEYTSAIYNDGELTINDGTFSGGWNTIINWYEMTINGGAFSNSSDGCAVIGNYEYAYITGGDFTATGSACTIWNEGYSYDYGQIDIIGGTFTSESYVLYDNSIVDAEDYRYPEEAYIAIYGGDFTGTITAAEGSIAGWWIEGGTYDTAFDKAYLADYCQLAAKGESVTDEDAPDYYVFWGVGQRMEASVGSSNYLMLSVYLMGAESDWYGMYSGSLDDVTYDYEIAMEGDNDPERQGSWYSYVYVEDYNSYFDCFVVSQCIDPRMMTHKLTVTFYLSDGYVITYETSVKEYAEKVLLSCEAEERWDYETSNRYWTLVSMLNYGAAAQLYTDYESTNLANDGWDMRDMDAFFEAHNDSKVTQYENSLYTAEDMKDAELDIISKDNDYAGASLYSMSMYFDYDYTLKLKFTETIDGTDGGSAFSVDWNNTRNGVCSVDGNVLTISGMDAADMYNTMQFKITDSNEKVMTIRVNSMYYAYLLASSDNEKCRFLGEALYTYALWAIRWRTGEQ